MFKLLRIFAIQNCGPPFIPPFIPFPRFIFTGAWVAGGGGGGSTDGGADGGKACGSSYC